ncbi:MAG: hypothetical protein ACTHJ5_13735 [Ilyomonas sp.]
MNNALHIKGNETSAFENFVINMDKEMQYEAEGRRLSKFPHWKKYFYKAYRKKNYPLASAIYFNKHPYRKDIMDVHKGYKLERQTDRDMLIAIITLTLIVVSTVVGFMHLF